MKFINYILILVFTVFFSCLRKDIDRTFSQQLSDSRSTELLKEYHQTLCRRLEKGIMLGHQDALAYGSMWYGEEGRSDIKSICGNNPAVVGWNLNGIETASPYNSDSVAFAEIKRYVKELDICGGISTFTWNIGKLVKDNAPELLHSANTIASFLPENENHAMYTSYLDSLSVFLSGITNDKGDVIPVILKISFGNDNKYEGQRNQGRSDNESYKALWINTVDYLRKTKKIHHILYAYSVYNPFSEEEILKYYPGDEYVDIVGIELYVNANQNKNEYKEHLDRSLSLITMFADKHKKIPTLSETGQKGVKISDLFSSVISPVLSKYKLSYVLFGRNAWNTEDDYYVPMPGHPASDDFFNFVNQSHILIGEKIEKISLKN